MSRFISAIHHAVFYLNFADNAHALSPIKANTANSGSWSDSCLPDCFKNISLKEDKHREDKNISLKEDKDISLKEDKLQLSANTKQQTQAPFSGAEYDAFDFNPMHKSPFEDVTTNKKATPEDIVINPIAKNDTLQTTNSTATNEDTLLSEKDAALEKIIERPSFTEAVDDGIEAMYDLQNLVKQWPSYWIGKTVHVNERIDWKYDPDASAYKQYEGESIKDCKDNAEYHVKPNNKSEVGEVVGIDEAAGDFLVKFPKLKPNNKRRFQNKKTKAHLQTKRQSKWPVKKEQIVLEETVDESDAEKRKRWNKDAGKVKKAQKKAIEAFKELYGEEYREVIKEKIKAGGMKGAQYMGTATLLYIVMPVVGAAGLAAR